MKEKVISSFDGTRIHYIASGNLNKIPVIFLHGITGNRTSWYYQAKFLEKKNIPFIIFELRGHGKSQGRFSKGFIEDSVNDILYIFSIEKIKKAIFIGNCTGAMITYRFYNKYKNLVSKVILVNPSHRITRLGVIFSAAPYAVISSLMLKPFVKKKVYDKTKSSGSKLYFNATANTNFISLIRANIDNILFSYKKNKVKHKNKILLIASDKDPLFSLKSQKKLALFLNSKIKIIKNTDHEALRQKPKEINTIIYDFIKNGKHKPRANKRVK